MTAKSRSSLPGHPPVDPGRGGLPTLETDAAAQSPGDATSDAQKYQQLFIEQLGTIRAVIAYVARRHRLTSQEAEEFASHVYLKLIEDSYLVFRKFQGRSSLRTYLTVIIQRLFLDCRIAQWGKWRPSSFAKRHGETALLLERLTTYRGLSFQDACETLETEHGVTIGRRALEAIYVQLPSRPRRLFVGEDALDDTPAEGGDPTSGLAAEERATVASRVSQMLAGELARLSPGDRELLRARFREGLSVADIARSTGQDSKVLYRRLTRLLHELRANLEAQGLDRSQMIDLTGADLELAFRWDAREATPGA